MAENLKNVSPERNDDSSGRIVTWTTIAVILSVVISWKWLTPILLGAPIAVSIRKGTLDYVTSRSVLLRWSVTVLICLVIASAFMPERVQTSVPFGTSVAESVRVWMASDGAAVWSLAWVAIAVVAFSLAAFFTGGILGYVVMATLLANAAVCAASIYGVGRNLFESSIIALSPWQWAILAGCWVLATPLALTSPSAVRWQSTPTDSKVVRRDLMVGFGLFALALLLRLAISGPYESAVRSLSAS